MNLVTWGVSPWGQPIILHAAWHLLWYALIAGVAFVLAHAAWVLLRPSPAPGPGSVGASGTADALPRRIVRHSLPARIFHWVMAAAMLVLLGTAFLPKAGLPFDWVGAHVWAGAVLLAAIAFHVVHALCCMDFRAIWPTPGDLGELRGIIDPPQFAKVADGPVRRPGKYPLGNKLYHLALVAVGLTLAATGLALLVRVPTPFLPRAPHSLFDDAGWGAVYALHGLAGLSLVALVIIHVYFALRPEKRPITLSMLTGAMDRDYYLTHHDPERWRVDASPPPITQ